MSSYSNVILFISEQGGSTGILPKNLAQTPSLILFNSFEVLQEDGDDSGCVLETNVDNHSSFYNEDRLPEEEPKTNLANYGSVNINSTG